MRNTDLSDHIVYFGPMGCRTGCIFLTRGLSDQDAIVLTQQAFDFIRNYEGDIPGVSEKECGNYRDHSLEEAKKDAEDMCEVLKDWKEDQLKYPEKQSGFEYL
ncbi:S-ribosylhomocysteine lyase [bioreactor metagenome]|uniref:S-ribosylhomocysteine lyase n=1 Tax=bioreactor metagenome TaxID=1076179 RepID=A0A645I839_9ZZZZ